jgi:hypothetical protein
VWTPREQGMGALIAGPGGVRGGNGERLGWGLAAEAHHGERMRALSAEVCVWAGLAARQQLRVFRIVISSWGRERNESPPQKLGGRAMRNKCIFSCTVGVAGSAERGGPFNAALWKGFNIFKQLHQDQLATVVLSGLKSEGVLGLLVFEDRECDGVGPVANQIY